MSSLPILEAITHLTFAEHSPSLTIWIGIVGLHAGALHTTDDSDTRSLEGGWVELQPISPPIVLLMLVHEHIITNELELYESMAMLKIKTLLLA